MFVFPPFFSFGHIYIGDDLLRKLDINAVMKRREKTQICYIHEARLIRNSANSNIFSVTIDFELGEYYCMHVILDS